MVVIGGNLPHRTRKGDRQLARRVVRAEQHIGDGIAALGSGEPGFQQRIGMLPDPPQLQRATIHQHHHQWLAGGDQGFEQRLLAGRQGQTGPAGRFVGHATGLAQSRDDHIGLARRTYRFVDHRLRRTRVLDHLRAVPVEEVQVLDHAGIVGDVGAARVDDPAVLAKRSFEALAQRHGLRCHAGCRPAAEHVDGGIGQRPDQRDACIPAQWQRLPAVFQQHQGLARDLACRLAVQAAFGVDLGGVVHRPADAAIGIMEQTQVVLGAEHTADRLVDQLEGHFAAFDQAGQLLQIERVVHAQVDAGLDRQARGLAAIAGHAMAQQFIDGAVIADVKPAEAPVVAQQVTQQPAVGTGRHAVDGVQRHHHATGAGVHRRTVGRQVILVHALRAHVDHVVITPALHRTVQGEVLDAGHHAVRGAQALALIGAHQRAGDLRDQVRIFAEALGRPPPARVAGDVHHGREGQIEAVGTGLDGRNPTAQGDGVEVPA